MKKVLALLILSFTALGLAAVAQTPPAATPAPAAPAAKAAPPTELERKVQEVSRLVQAGKAAEALPRLQALEKDPATTLPVRAFVGVLYLELGKAQEARAVLKPLADPEDAQPAVLYQAGRPWPWASRTRRRSTSPAPCSRSRPRRRPASWAC